MTVIDHREDYNDHRPVADKRWDAAGSPPGPSSAPSRPMPSARASQRRPDPFDWCRRRGLRSTHPCRGCCKYSPSTLPSPGSGSVRASPRVSASTSAASAGSAGWSRWCRSLTSPGGRAAIPWPPTRALERHLGLLPLLIAGLARRRPVGGHATRPLTPKSSRKRGRRSERAQPRAGTGCRPSTLRERPMQAARRPRPGGRTSRPGSAG